MERRSDRQAIPSCSLNWAVQSVTALRVSGERLRHGRGRLQSQSRCRMTLCKGLGRDVAGLRDGSYLEEHLLRGRLIHRIRDRLQCRCDSQLCWILSRQWMGYHQCQDLGMAVCERAM